MFGWLGITGRDVLRKQELAVWVSGPADLCTGGDLLTEVT